MEGTLLIFVGILLLLPLLRLSLKSLAHGRSQRHRLPPGPPAFPFIGNIFWLRHSIADLGCFLRHLRSRYGSIVTLHIGSTPSIFIFDRELAHEALVRHSAILAHRPPLHDASRFFSSDGFTVNHAGYGPLCLLRRNISSGILHPSRIKLYSNAREYIARSLLDSLRDKAAGNSRVVAVRELFHDTIFRIVTLMCFGEDLNVSTMAEMRQLLREMLLYTKKVEIFSLFPGVARYIFYERWQKMLDMRRRQLSLILPLIQAHRARHPNGTKSVMFSYLGTLLELELGEEYGHRKLTDEEVMTLCSEFINAGTDSSATALEWIMARVMKHSNVQEKLYEELGKVGLESNYLRAIIMEGLRRHPPGHFVLPHAVTEEVVIGGYVIPKKATINFAVSEMGLDGEAWKDAVEFRPERFLEGEGLGVDITGRRGIQMMPFGAGKRMCPAYGLGVLHLELLVASMVEAFEWKPVEEDGGVDLSETMEFTTVMKVPLKARIFAR